MSDIATKSAGQKRAEAAVEGFRRDLGPFVVAAETTRMPMVFTDARAIGHPIIFANDSVLAQTGYTREELLGQRLDFLWASDDSSRKPSPFRDAFATDTEAAVEGRCRRKNGEVFRAALFVSPVHDKAGDPVQHFISLLDLSQHEREEERLRFLLDELNHRTQNTLASVQSIVLRTLRGNADPGLIDTLERRILALSKAHGLLGRDNWDAVLLREVLDQILRAIDWNGHPAPRVCDESPEVGLSPQAVLSLALVLHELATNATRHGALSGSADGKVDIDWAPTPDGERMQLRWRESGGPPVQPPTRQGFGRGLLEGSLAQELHGEVRLDFAPSGLVCTIVMPVFGGPGAMCHA